MKKYKKLLLFLFAFFLVNILKAASVDTINIYSVAMHKGSKCVIVLPDSYTQVNKQFPVVYLLHGYSGNYADWIKKVPSIKDYADEFQLIIVCPDGHYNSWYVDSPVDSSIRYEKYVGLEVPHYIDSAYHTIARRNERAITGLSMGGQGALSIAWKHADFFGAAGSMSGVQDLSPWKNGYELTKVLGDTLNNNNFQNYSVVNLVKKRPSKILAIIFDCGVSDPFIETNRLLNEELLKMKFPHDYTERNGTHNWEYWSNSIAYQLMFFISILTVKCPNKTRKISGKNNKIMTIYGFLSVIATIYYVKYYCYCLFISLIMSNLFTFLFLAAFLLLLRCR